MVWPCLAFLGIMTPTRDPQLRSHPMHHPSRLPVAVFRLMLLVSLVYISYLAFAPVAPSVNDKGGHMAAFLVLSGLLDFSFPDSRFGARKIAALIGYGLLIEVVQYHLPHRTFELADVAADTGGIALYLLVTPLLRRLPYTRRRWRDR